MKTIFKIFITLIVVVNISHASGQRRPPVHPPKEAVIACAERDDSDECEFVYEGRVLSGACFSLSRDLPLACKPYGHETLAPLRQ